MTDSRPADPDSADTGEKSPFGVIELDAEKFFQLSIDLVCIAGTDGRFKRVNPAFTRVLGWTMDELLTRPFYDFVHPEDLAATNAELSKLAQGISTISFENRYRCSDESYKNLAWTAQPDPATGLLYCIARDMTGRHRRARELEVPKEAAESATKVKSQFLADMSHEIRTPMNGIIGMAEVALQTATEAPAREQLQVIRQSAEALLLLLHDILDFSKIEADKIEIDARTFELREVIGDAVKTLAVEAHRGGLELSFEVDASVPRHLVGDPLRLRQVVLNLVGNAVKFTDDGEVALRVWSRPRGDDHELTVEVTDTGIGIAEEKQGSIFESFSQGDSTWRRRFGGTGLGLAICARLVELMGGSIELESHEGRGSTFRFTVVLGSAITESSLPTPPALHGRRALVVVNSTTIRAVLGRSLEAFGMSVTGRGDLTGALEHLGERRDYHLVFVEGAAVLASELVVRSIRALIDGGAIVALLTTQELKHQARLLGQVGVDACLTKPFKRSELVDCAARALGLSAVSALQVSRQESVAAHTPLHVLLVEDSHVNQQVATGLLESAGHRVDVVDTGGEAVRAAAEGRYDVVLMDVQMPEMDGLEATRRIRERENESGAIPVQIVALTAHARDGDRERCLNAGMSGYLAKPLRAVELMGAIHEVSSHFEERRAAQLSALTPVCDDLDISAAL